ncbi:MAG: hypothetical protein KDK36_01775 [Leptospiraceae bacterium]|nr:hypothetical protein [Leptospiraceae bacterium]
MFLSFVSCSFEKLKVSNTDPKLGMGNGKLLYDNKLFTGILEQYIPALNEIRTTEFKDGVEHGEMIVKKKDGKLIERRTFNQGIKHGLHEGWYPNGQRRFYTTFNNGAYVNERFEWHDNGNPFIYQKYDENSKTVVYKQWRNNKEIYINISFYEDGSSIGLPGSKLCEPVEENNVKKK